MNMEKIELLPFERWAELEEIFEHEFKAILPDGDKANILAALDEGGNIKGFIVVETLLRAGQVYVAPDGANNGNLPRKFFSYLENNIPRGASVIVIASEERFEGLVRHLGFREVEGKIFRRDL